MSIDAIWAKDENALFAEVGEAVLSTDMGMTAPSLEQMIRAGKEWMEAKKSLLCQLICSHQGVKAAILSGALGKDFAALIIDILEHHVTALSPIPPASAGLLFCRLGYFRLCPDHSH